MKHIGKSLCAFLCPKGGEKKVLEKTNLEKVKMIARALLMTEIHETEFSPAVVQHPFTSSGITVLPRDGILQLGDICKNEKDLAAWHLVKQYCATFGIELMPQEDGEAPISFDIAKGIQDYILEQFEDAGVRFNFEAQETDEAEDPAQSM